MSDLDTIITKSIGTLPPDDMRFIHLPVEDIKQQIKDLMIRIYDEDYYTFKKNLETL